MADQCVCAVIRGSGGHSLAGRRFFIAACLMVFAWGTVVCRAAEKHDWRGFRGLERQGVAASGAAPVEWSAERNVKWKTPIPGRGHSSPVVSADRVYLTTAYPSPFVERIRVAVQWAGAGLAGLLAVVLAVWMVLSLETEQRKPGLRRFLWTYAVGVVGMGAVGLVLFGPSALGFEDRADNAWLGAVLIVIGGLMVAGVVAPAVSGWRLAVAAATACLTVPACLTIPDKDVLFRIGSGTGMVMWFALATLVFLGAGLATSHFLARRGRRSAPHSSQETASGQGGALWATGVLAGVLATVLLAALGLQYMAGRSAAVASFVGNVRFLPTIGWVGLVTVGVLVIAATVLALRRLLHRRPAWRKPLTALGFVTAVLLASLTLADWNLLLGKERTIYAVVSVNREDGRIEWVREVLTAFGNRLSGENSPATPTPVVADGRVYAFFGTPGLACVDAEGDTVWSTKALPFRGLYGPATSPVLHDGVLVQVTDSDPKRIEAGEGLPLITAFEAATGKVLWRHACENAGDRPTGAGYMTPIIVTHEERDIVIVRCKTDVRGYDLRNGNLVWRYPIKYEGVDLVPSPVCDGERIYLVEPRRTCALAFTRLSEGEGAEVWSRDLPGPMCASPVLFGGRLIVVSSSGLVTCLDAASGQTLWKQRLRGEFFPSLAASGDRIYVCSNAGCTTVLTDAGRILAENDLPEQVRATPALANEQCFIRTTRHLYCIAEVER